LFLFFYTFSFKTCPTVSKALNDENWRLAMDAEFEALVKNNTWHLVQSDGVKNVIDCIWV
jgi:hypothetical protein